MTTKEMIEYLQLFDPESEVSIASVDTEKRLMYGTEEAVMIIDQGKPAFLIIMGKPEPFEELEEE